MTVTANTTRNDYVAGTNQNVYYYTFQLNLASNVTVLLGGVVQTLNVHYTVQNIGVGTGGTITFTLVDGSNNPIFPTAGTPIAIFMSMELDRDTDYQANGSFLAGNVNNDYDRLWLVANQQQTAINRTLRLKDQDVAGASPSMQIPLKAARLGKYLGFDGTTGEPIAVGSHQDGAFVLKAGDTMTGLLNNTVGYAVAGTTFIDSNKNITSVTGNISLWTNDLSYLTPTSTSALTNKSGAISQWTNDVGYLTSTTAESLAVTLAAGNTSGSNDIKMDNNQAVQFGTSNSNNIKISHSGSIGTIKEIGSGRMIIQGEAINIVGNDGISGMVISDVPSQTYNWITFQTDNATQLYITQNGIGLKSGSNVNEISQAVALGTSNSKLVTQGAIKSYVDTAVAGVPVGDITAVTVTAPITGGGTSGSVGIAITQSSASGNGYLSSTDWTTFNSKSTFSGAYADLSGKPTIPTNNNQLTNGAGYTTNTGTTTASNTQTFTNKSGNISQWTNDSGYLTSSATETLAATLVAGNTTGTTDISVSSGADIVMAANSKAIFNTNFEIYRDASNAIISETGAGSLILRGTNLSLQSDDNDQYIQCVENGAVTLYHQSGGNSSPKISTTTTGISITGNVVVTGNVDGRDVSADGITADAALPKSGGAMTGAITTNSTFDGVDIATRDAVLTSTTTTANAALPKAGGTVTGDIDFGDGNMAVFGAGDDLVIYHASGGGGKSYIKEDGNGNLDIMGSNLTLADSQGDFYLNATENGVVQIYCDNEEKLRTVGSGVRVYGALVTDNLETNGYLRGPTSFTIDPSPHNANTGTVNIAGNLNVQGTTTTIDSVTLEIEDPHILLNKGQTGTPASNLISGFIVDRGNSTDVDMVWLESGSGGWFAKNPNGTRYQLVDSNNFETMFPILDGGTF